MRIASSLSVLLVAATAYAHHIDYSYKCYSAVVNTNGVKANMILCPRGQIKMNVFHYLDTKHAKRKALPPTCDLKTIHFHVHDFWRHNDTTQAFSSECGATLTGGHYDPTFACGPLTGQRAACDLIRPTIKGFNYTCNPHSFPHNPYGCEVGDISGKFGHIHPPMQRKWLFNRDSFGVPNRQYKGKSIVWHCAGNERVFCAKLIEIPDRYLNPYRIFDRDE